MSVQQLNAALAEFHARTMHKYDRVTDLAAIKDLADLRGWHWIALAITRWELEQSAQACGERWDKIEPLPVNK